VRTVAIVQARTSSTRLPRKVLLDIAGRPMLDWVVSRAGRARLLDEVMVATTERPEDDAIVALCRTLSVRCFRGSEDDVLDRYYHAALESSADIVVRITSDCPLIDPGEMDRVLESFRREQPSYASNSLLPGFLRGLDTEAMTMAALTQAWREARAPYQRVHVTPFLYQNPQLFRLLAVRFDRDFGAYRWTVDTPEDLQLIRTLVERFGADDRLSWQGILEVFSRDPGLVTINGHVRQKRLEEG
jgi:spore coat polysaccharide biosynthesis protein SpsF